jgi:hypothetical protein
MASLARISSSLTCRSVLIARRMAVIAHPECGRAGRCVAVIAITSRGSACLSGRLSWIARACEGTLYGQWKRGGEHPDMTPRRPDLHKHTDGTWRLLDDQESQPRDWIYVFDIDSTPN